MTKHNGVITTTRPPTCLHLDAIDIAVALSHERHKPRSNTTAYVQIDTARELADACDELCRVVVELSDEQALNAKQRYALVKAKSALGKSRHILREPTR